MLRRLFSLAGCCHGKALLLVLLASLPLVAKAQQTVNTWVYNLEPPFAINLDQQQGLSFDLVSLLNQHPANAGRFHFDLHFLPRKRLDRQLARGDVGMVLWVNPIFFLDQQQAATHWSGTLLMDEQSFVSRQDKPFDYHGPNSLEGRTLGTVLGHQYLGLQEHFAQGLIQREDVRVDKPNLKKLLSKRIDLMLIPRSTADYFSSQLGLSDKLYFSPQPLTRYSRQIMLTAGAAPELQAFIQRTVDDLPHNPVWLALLNQYGLASTAQVPLAPQGSVHSH